MEQTGGALLGQGAYGCTFDPAPPCAGGTVFKTISGLPAVGKITIEEIESELEIGKAIMALPLAAQYFALPTASCIAGDPIQDPEAKGCRVLSDTGKETKLSLLLMPAAGKQLLKWAMNLTRLAANFERVFRHLLEGMVIYHDAGFIHNDIHMGNILIDDMGVARYIDFGLGFQLDKIQTWEDTDMGKQFRPKHGWQAPEVHAWRMIHNGIRLEAGISQLRNVHREYVRMERSFPHRMPADKALAIFMNDAPKDGGEFIRLYAKKFDCWRIGLCMYMLWEDLMDKLIDLPNVSKIRRVISGLTEFDPRSRISAGEALFILDPRSRFSSKTVKGSEQKAQDLSTNPRMVRVPDRPTLTF